MQGIVGWEIGLTPLVGLNVSQNPISQWPLHSKKKKHKGRGVHSCMEMDSIQDTSPASLLRQCGFFLCFVRTWWQDKTGKRHEVH